MKRNTVKKFISLLLVSVVTLSLVACGNGGAGGTDTTPVSPEAAPATDTPESESPDSSDSAAKTDLKYILKAEPEILDPTLAADSAPTPIFSNIFEGLTALDANDNVIAGQAESWDISDDGLVYTFHLRANAKWSDGQPIKAEDYAYSWERLLNPATAANYSWIMLPYVKNAQNYFDEQVTFEEVGIKAINDSTLEVTLENPTGYFLELCAYAPYTALRKDIVDSNPDWTKTADTFVTSGAFKVNNIKFGQGITLAKNENYWNADSVKLTSVQFDYVTDGNTAISSFEAGDVDGSNNVPAAEIPRLKVESDGFFALPKIQTIFINFNTTVEPLNDVRVRQALNLAIDKQLLIDEVLKGSQTVAEGLVAQGIKVNGQEFRDLAGPGVVTGTFEENVAKAKQLLADAGYPDGAGYPVLEIQDDSSDLTQVIAKMWEDNLGIKTNINVVEWKTHLAEMKKLDIQIGMGGWTGDYQHPTTYLDMYTSNSGTNYTGWQSDEYEALLSKAAMETDPAKAAALYVEAEKLFLDAQPIAPLYYSKNNVVVNPSLKGWSLSALGYLQFKNAYFE